MKLPTYFLCVTQPISDDISDIFNKVHIYRLCETLTKGYRISVFTYLFLHSIILLL